MTVTYGRVRNKFTWLGKKNKWQALVNNVIIFKLICLYCNYVPITINETIKNFEYHNF